MKESSETTPFECSPAPRIRSRMMGKRQLLVSALIGGSLLLLLLRSVTSTSIVPPFPPPMSHFSAAPRLSLSLGSFNIRYDPRSGFSSSDPDVGQTSFESDSEENRVTVQEWGERPWRERRTKVADQVLWSELDIVGFQEALVGQVEDLKKLLGSGYGCVGVGRDDGKAKGEFLPVFWRRDRITLLSVRHFWLSETPEVPGSISWDAGQTRMVTLVHFKFTQHPHDPPSPSYSRREDFYVLNTHWDDRGLKARGESAKVILKQVGELIRKESESDEGKTELPLVVLLGDLNAPPSEEGYQILTGRKYDPKSRDGVLDEVQAARGGGLAFLDTRNELELASPSTLRLGEGLLHSGWGDRHTFTGFGRDDRKQVIDVVLMLDPSTVEGGRERGEERSWRVMRYGVVPNRFDDGVGGMLISDHRLVVAKLVRE